MALITYIITVHNSFSFPNVAQLVDAWLAKHVYVPVMDGPLGKGSARWEDYRVYCEIQDENL